jgi:hypothetical protein
MFNFIPEPLMAPDTSTEAGRKEAIRAIMNEGKEVEEAVEDTVEATTEATDDFSSEDLKILEETTKEEKPAVKLAGKYDSVDELEKGYKNAQTGFLKKATEADKYKKLAENLQSEFENLKAEMQSLKTEPTPEDKPDFYENPDEAVNKAVEQKLREMGILEKTEDVSKKLSAIEEKRRVDSIMQDFIRRTPDYVDYQVEMAQFLKDYPDVAQLDNALDIAYKAAKKPGFSELAPDNIVESLTDEQKNAVVRAHLAKIKASNNAPTINVGNDAAPALEKKEAKNYDEAKPLIQRILKGSGMSFGKSG